AGQHLELGRGEAHLAAVDRHLALLEVDLHAADRGRLGRQYLGGAAPPQERLRPRDQLARAERLGQVVVGPDLEPVDLVGLGRPRGQHQDRHRRVHPHAPHDLEPVQLRHHQVEDHQVGNVGHRLGERVLAVTGGYDLVALPLEQEGNQVTDVLVVVCDQYARHRAQWYLVAAVFVRFYARPDAPQLSYLL